MMPVLVSWSTDLHSLAFIILRLMSCVIGFQVGFLFNIFFCMNICIFGCKMLPFISTFLSTMVFLSSREECTFAAACDLLDWSEGERCLQ